MNILAVDTAGSMLTVAVRTDTYFEEANLRPQGMRHSETIMPAIFDICRSCNTEIADIDLFVCTRGPGSFTGLRIGMATVKGLAFGLEKPVVSVSTLEYHAKSISHFDGCVIPAIDARKDKYYLGVFECREGECRRLMSDIDGTVDDLERYVDLYSSVLVAGPDREVFAGILKDKYPLKNITTECEYTVPKGVALIDLGLERYGTLGADDIGQGPVYLRKSDAEIALEEKLAKEKDNV